jgi:hypothetical protein
LIADVTPELETYLCSYHGGMFRAAAGSIDRTREVRCGPCWAATPMDAVWSDDVIEDRLRGITV